MRVDIAVCMASENWACRASWSNSSPMASFIRVLKASLLRYWEKLILFRFRMPFPMT